MKTIKPKIKVVPKSFVKWLEKNFQDTDKIDVDSEYDRSLTLDENKSIFVKKWSTLKRAIPEKLTAREKKEKMLEVDKSFNTAHLEEVLGVKICFVED